MTGQKAGNDALEGHLDAVQPYSRAQCTVHGPEDALGKFRSGLGRWAIDYVDCDASLKATRTGAGARQRHIFTTSSLGRQRNTGILPMLQKRHKISLTDVRTERIALWRL